ncbi:AsmA-like C-terminal region [Tenacibaculum sp. MAR_2009_124]|uniref:AsmA family protein n=1 Tax=Tenacibaculum sp. MAR_2009_124 TaxID=1250059 RepID=UPI00089C5D3F|nr:AsmA-like C-terminal region-containing protein [Tenacibaculum sp. MAR_2009_124]SEC54261.1 AsmA-like C-terminal region [Tenacibaculum sp. MAR_2009_124]
MKKLYKIILGAIVFLFLLLLTAPLLFKDKIVSLIKDTANENLNAKVDFSDVNLSFLRNFPNASISLTDVSIINFKPFEGDTLLYAKEVNGTLKLTDLFNEKKSIKSFSIDNAKVNVLTNKDGIANYQITKTDSEAKPAETKETEPSSFTLSIESYSISDSNINYEDKKGNIHLLLTDFNHSGSGDFSQSNSELKTKTNTTVSFDMEDTNYVKEQKISLDAVLGMDLVNNKFSFLKNEAKLNNLPLVFDGYVKLNENNQEVSVHFKTPSSDFKNFLGLIPEVYAKNISNVKTSGNFSVAGHIEGIVDDKNIPKLDITLKAENASFKYPDLPKSVRNINISSQLKNTTGKVQNTFVTIDNLSFKIDEDVFSGNGSLHNLTTNPLVNANLKGTLNLANINKAYPVSLENELSGILKANLNTRFDVNAIKKNIVSRIKNNGTVEIRDFIYSSKDIVNPIEIKNSLVKFTPKTVSLNEFQASTGKSDLNATGRINNLLGFLLSDKKLKGTFNVTSNSFYVSDFMEKNEGISSDKSPEEKDGTKSSEGSLKIPDFLDCKINADAQKVYYDNLTLSNVKGTLWLKDQKATLQNMKAGIFNGQISLNGEVNTQKEQPTFAMKLGVDSFDISQSFNTMDLLQSLSPIAGAMDGKLNSDINLSGSLNDDFTPNLGTVSGKALAQLLTTKIDPKKTKALSLLDSKLSFIDLTKLDLSDIKTHLSFKDGKVQVAPFKLNYKDIGINIGGSHGFDQSMNYNVTLDVPAKYLGSEVSGLLSKLSPKDQNITVPVTATISGNMKSPSVQTDLASSASKLSQKLIQQQKNDLVNNTLGNLLGGNKKDSTKTGKDAKGDAVDKVKDVLGGLFGKKKKKKN